MILQVGGSISFAPEGDGADAKWLSDDARHMLAELDPAPDQVTIAINTNQMNIVELMTDEDIAGTSFERPEVYEAYREMFVPAGPEWVVEHLKRLRANGIQPHFQLANIAAAGDRRAADPPRPLHGPAQPDLGRHRRRLRRPEPVQHDELHQPGPGRRLPDPGDADAQRAARQHDGHRHGPAHPLGNEDTLWGRKGEKMTSVQQVEQVVRIAKELGREVATGKEARDIYRIGADLRQRRRDPRPPGLRAQPQARPARLHLPRLTPPGDARPTHSWGAG